MKSQERVSKDDAAGGDEYEDAEDDVEDGGMNHRVDEKREHIERSETWNGDACGFEFGIHRDEQHTRVWIVHPGNANGIRLGIIDSYPKSVAALEAFAEKSREVLLDICRQMREAGLDDLRGACERRMDELDEHLEKMRKEFA